MVDNNPLRRECYGMNFTILLSYLFLLFITSGCLSFKGKDEEVEKIIWYQVRKEDSKRSVFENEKSGARENIENFIEGIKKKGTLSLHDCLALALAHNERLKIVGEDYFQAIIDKNKALSMVLPDISLKGQYFVQETVPGFGGSSFSPKARTDYWVSFRQPLFRGLSDIYTLKAAKKRIKSKEYSLFYERTQIFSFVISVFYELLQLQKKIEILDATVKIRKERLEEMKEKRKLGILRETEVLLVETQLAQDEAILEQTRNEMMIAKSLMETLIGIPLDKPLEDMPANGSVRDLPELLNFAYSHRMDLKSREIEIEALKDKLKATLGEYLPQISFSNNIYLKRSGYLKEIDWDAAISFELPIFEGWLTKARIEEDLSTLRQAKYSYDSLKKQITQEIKSAFYQLKTTRALISRLEKEVKLARKNYDMLKEEYKQNIATHLELLFAEVNLQTAKIRLETMKLEEKKAFLKLKIVTGEEIWSDEY
ncbi:MAG: TolC family protein [Planctomycetota bacterium]